VLASLKLLGYIYYLAYGGIVIVCVVASQFNEEVAYANAYPSADGKRKPTALIVQEVVANDGETNDADQHRHPIALLHDI
jgi:hypothetical protein